jgi:hypothetical protein
MDIIEARFTRGFFGDRILVNDGSLGFIDTTSLLFPNLPYIMDEGTSSSTADFDMDGYLDVFFSKYEQSLMLTGTQSGLYVDVTSERLPEDISTISTWADYGDVDGDGDPDIVISNLLQRNNCYMNQSVPDTISPTVSVIVRPIGSVLPGKNQTIKLHARDDALCLTSVRIMFRAGDGDFEQVVCYHLGGSLYAGEIPGQIEGTVVSYYAIVEDARMNISTDPVSVPDSLYTFKVGESVEIGNKDLVSVVPRVTSLLQNYPNPFNPYTIITFILGHEDVKRNGFAEVALSVFDNRGRKITDVFNGDLTPGRHTFTWSSRSGHGGGIYLIRLDVGERLFVRKAILLP